MPKNKGRGGKNYRRGKNENETKRELVFKEPEQEYAQVTKMLGNGRLETYCFDGKVRLGHIRGKLKKKVWIMTGDIVLVGVRDFQDNRCDVIYKYTPDEVRALKSYQEVPENIKINENDPNANQESNNIVFEEGEGDENENDNVAENPIKQPTDRARAVESNDSDEESDEEEEEEEEKKQDERKKDNYKKEDKKKVEFNIDDI